IGSPVGSRRYQIARSALLSLLSTSEANEYQLEVNQQKTLEEASMGSWLSEREQRMVAGAETASAATPIPTQIVSNGEYLPPSRAKRKRRSSAAGPGLGGIRGHRPDQMGE